MISRPALVPGAQDVAYLHAGDVYATDRRCSISTIVGSCVAVCLWDAQARRGGMNHFLLPRRLSGSDDSARYGDSAMRTLLERLAVMGSRPSGLLASVYGGANMLGAARTRGPHLGQTNVDLALTFLGQMGIPVLEANVGGQRGRRIVFEVATGAARAREL